MEDYKKLSCAELLKRRDEVGSWAELARQMGVNYKSLYDWYTTHTEEDRVHASHPRRSADVPEVSKLHDAGYNQTEIANKLGMARETVRKFLRAAGKDTKVTTKDRPPKTPVYPVDEIIRLWGGGYTPTTISEKLHVAPNVVKFYVRQHRGQEVGKQPPEPVWITEQSTEQTRVDPFMAPDPEPAKNVPVAPAPVPKTSMLTHLRRVTTVDGARVKYECDSAEDISVSMYKHDDGSLMDDPYTLSELEVFRDELIGILKGGKY